jgi:predicted unusual protein kinase regulating ubiquinone biosynthesis (AarF/ABC1/UbiB family)
LLRTTLEIPFSVPPYMSLLARSVATLEGIALLGDPNYQMVAQVRFGVKASETENRRTPHTAPDLAPTLSSSPFLLLHDTHHRKK